MFVFFVCFLFQKNGLILLLQRWWIELDFSFLIRTSQVLTKHVLFLKVHNSSEIGLIFDMNFSPFGVFFPLFPFHKKQNADLASGLWPWHWASHCYPGARSQNAGCANLPRCEISSPQSSKGKAFRRVVFQGRPLDCVQSSYPGEFIFLVNFSPRPQLVSY